MRRAPRVLVATLLALWLLPISIGSAAAAGFQTVVVTLAPQAPNTTGSGIAVLRFDATTGEVCHTIRVTGIGEPTHPLGGAHLHDVATNGIFIDLDTDWRQTGPNEFLSIGCADADPARVAAVLAAPGDYYVNVHTALFPGGALRGSLG